MSEHEDTTRNRRTAMRILAVGLPLVLIAGAGVGYAYWTSTGTGNGTASAASGPAGISLTGTATGLTPGGSVTVPIMATNPNSYRVAIAALTATPASFTCAGASPGADISVGTPSLSSTFVPAGGPTQVGSVVVTMNDTSSNQDACKGASFTLTFGAS
jgi:hypothetical protein